MKRVFIFSNRVKKSLAVKNEVTQLLKQHGFILTKNKPDVIVVIGGDGTMLSAIRSFHQQGVPFLGVNTGSLGFLPGAQPGEIVLLPQLIEGQDSVQDVYPLLEVHLTTVSGKKFISYAFNEIVIKQHQARLLEALLYIDHKPFNYFTGDGLIISTPIGSTGYAIWAGGASIHTAEQVYQITPINPNDNRINRPLRHSLIIPDKTHIHIRMVKANKRSINVAVDGLMVTEEYVAQADIISSERKVRIMRLRDTSYFDLFRNKIVDKNIYRFLEEEDANNELLKI